MSISELLTDYLTDTPTEKRKELSQLRAAITEALNDEQDYAPEDPQWVPVRLIMRDDTVGGGLHGNLNKPIIDLAKRMAYIKKQNEDITEQAKTGFVLLSSFEEGATLTLSNEVLLYKADSQYYRWTGDLPKTVDANSTPESTGGIGAGFWVLIGDSSIKSILTNTDDENLGDALIGVKQPFVGAVARTQHDKNSDIVSIKDFGAVCDGVVDDTDSFIKAIDNVHLNKGTYLLSEDIENKVFITDADTKIIGKHADISHTNDINNSTYRKRLISNMKLKFSGYDEAISLLSVTSLYPQGIAFDEKGWCYISYVSDTNNGGVIVVHDESFVQQSWFIVPDLKVENISVNKGFLYFRGADFYLHKVDISTVNTGSIISEFVNLNIKASANFSYSHGRWIIGRDVPPLGDAKKNRTVYDFYDDDFNYLGYVNLNPALCGFITKDDSELYNYIPKSQGILLHKDKIYLGIGNYWNVNDPTKHNSAFGAAELTLDGNLCRYGVISYSGFKEYLEISCNLTVSRVESEGLGYNPKTNLLCSLLVIGESIVLVSEFDAFGLDFEKIKAKYSPPNFKQLSRLPIQYDNNLYNPITGQPFDSQISIMKFMSDMNIFQFQYYSSFALNIRPVDETFTGDASLITIKNCSGRTFIIEVGGLVNHTNRIYFSSSDFSSYSIYPQTAMKQNVFSFLSHSGNRFMMPTQDKLNNIGLFNGYSDGTTLNKLYLGSSQSGQFAPTSIGFCIANTTTSKGLERISVIYDYMYPVPDSAINLGRSSNRWNNIYSSNGVITTSDARLKTEIESLTEAEKRVAVKLKELIKKFKFTKAVEEKADSARIHVGVIAQDVITAFKSEKLDAFNYGVLCYDKWDSSEEITETTEDGQIITVQSSMKAGDRYSIRYDELAMFILAGL